MNSNAETICKACNKPVKPASSMTQWIFDSNRCSCNEVTIKASDEIRCALCGLPVKSKVGTITQWIFKTNTCACLVSEETNRYVDHADLPSDDLISGSPYHFEGVTGHGGISTVYKAHYTKLGRPVAIKLLQANTDERAKTVFLREARAASKLQHPNVVAVQDFGTMIDGRDYLVTEWIDGITLQQYIGRQKRLSVATSVEIFSQILDGLAHAHNRNVIHRDIKPSNIMLARGEAGGWIVKIIDFGTAKEIATDSEPTRAQDLPLSPQYMSPEMIGGSIIDHRADLYSLGCSLFEALTGRPPFMGQALPVVMKHEFEEPPTLEIASGGIEFPENIQAIVRKLLDKDPDKRYQSALEVKNHLKNWKRIKLTNGEIAASTEIGQSKNLLLAASFAAGLVLLGVAACFVFNFGEPPATNVPTRKKAAPAIASEWVNGDPDAECGMWLDPRRQPHKFSRRTPLSKLPANEVRVLQIVSQCDLTALPTFEHLNALNFENCNLSTADFDKIITVPRLEELNFSHCLFSTEWLAKLSRLPSLRRMNVLHSQRLDQGLTSALSKIQQLEFLTIRNSSPKPVWYVEKSEDLRPIGQLKSLRGLDISTYWIDDAGLKHLLELPKLETLAFNDALTSVAAWTELARNVKLDELILTTGATKDEALKVICTIKTLKRLNLAESQITNVGLTYIPRLKSLESLNLSGCHNLTDKGIQNLKQRMPAVEIKASSGPEWRLTKLALLRSRNQAMAAVEEASRGLEEYPGNPHLLVERAWAKSVIGKPNEALQDYETVLKQNSKFSPALASRSGLHLSMHKYDEALKDANEALRLNDTNTIAHRNRGLAYFHLRNYTECVSDLTYVIAKDPEDPHPYFFRAAALEALKDESSALRDYTNYLTVVRNNDHNTLNAFDKRERGRFIEESKKNIARLKAKGVIPPQDDLQGIPTLEF